MAESYLETGAIAHNFESYGFSNVLAGLDRELEDKRRHVLEFLDVADADTEVDEAEFRRCQEELSALRADKDLLRRYPQEFPVLYAVRQRETEDNVRFSMREVPAVRPEIVTEDKDVLPRSTRLELVCDLEDAGEFTISAEQYDRAGEDMPQMRAKIGFAQKTLDDLNAERLKRILEFCEKHGLPMHELSFPMKDGQIDVDEKLASLTQQLMENSLQENVGNPGPESDCENPEEFALLETVVHDVEQAPRGQKPKAKKPYTIDKAYEDMVDMLEKDLHKTRGLSYFVHRNRVDGLRTMVFSIYDKPNKDNEKNDGLKDKNGNYVPTYSYRLYVSQAKDGHFVFGYATPGGKKIDDAMAGDFVGLIKKTGATHIRFSNVHNLEKGVWLVACAEKGIVPIGISINMSKAKKMVESARGKLSDEEFITFKRNLAAQMLENAKDKKLDKSELTYIQTLTAAYDFEAFRVASDDLIERVNADIAKAAQNEENGAALAMGAMHTLRSVFDLYFKHNDQTVGERLQDMLKQDMITPEEREALNALPQSIKLSEMTPAHFITVYEALLPRQIEKNNKDILQAFSREFKNKVRRAPGVVLTADLFPKAKGAVAGINILLRQSGIDALTLPLEHNGLYYADPNQRENATPENTRQATPTQKEPAKAPTPEARNEPAQAPTTSTQVPQAGPSGGRDSR